MSAHNFTVERRERGQYVDFVVMCDGRYEVAETSSADIARAISSHAAVCEALRDLMEYEGEMQRSDTVADSHLAGRLERARAALAQARGEA